MLTNDNSESRKLVEQCYKNQQTALNPIVDWTDTDVWEFIRGESIPYCALYDEGFRRLGCIGCPVARRREREKEFNRWPMYKAQYLRSFEKMIDLRVERNRKNPEKRVWAMNGKVYTADNPPTVQEIFNWWMEYDILPGQIDLLETESESER